MLTADKELEEIIKESKPPHPRLGIPRGLIHRDYMSVAALDEVESLMNLRGAGANRSPELAELHLGYLSLRERVSQALHTFLGQKEMDRISARAAAAAAAAAAAGQGGGQESGLASSTALQTADQQAYQTAHAALSGQTPIARADVKAAFEADPLLCFIIEQTVHCLDNGRRCLVNKIKQSGGYGSWIDNIFTTLDATDKPLAGLEGVWNVVTGKVVEPPAYIEPEEFLVEVTRHIDGLQGVVQAFAGGPILAGAPLSYMSVGVSLCVSFCVSLCVSVCDLCVSLCAYLCVSLCVPQR